MNIEELKRLAEAATPGKLAHGVTWIEHIGGIITLGHTARSKHDVAFIASANPATILYLIAEVERLRDEVNGLTGTADRAQAEIRALEDKLVRLQCQNGLTPGVEQ